MGKDALFETTPTRTRLYSPEAGEAFISRNDPDMLAINRVLRLKRGDCVACFNGNGVEYFYRIERVSRDGVELALQGEMHNPHDPTEVTTVWIASSKGKTKDDAVRSLTALGVTRIVFFQAERSVSKPESRITERLFKIAVEACRQCGRSTIPTIDVYDSPLSEVLDNRRQPLYGILFWEESPYAPIPTFVSKETPVDIVFGPEGGFTREEVEWARDYGFAVAGLGPRILRTELAVVVGVTMIQSRRSILGGSDN